MAVQVNLACQLQSAAAYALFTLSVSRAGGLLGRFGRPARRSNQAAGG
tara:strand:+ start:552 stop:695 length:144 start_codon:yes stop_codon:yes gene_type:complete